MCYITSFLLLHLLKMSRTNASGWMMIWLANNTFNNVRPRATQLLLMHHFSLSMQDLKINMINVKYVTDFQWFCGVGEFLSRRMCYPVRIHCYKWPNYDFCISQESAVTVLRWGKLSYSHLCHFFHNAVYEKLSKSANVSWSYSKNKSGTFFIETQCI